MNMERQPDSLPESALDGYLNDAQRILTAAQHDIPPPLSAPDVDEAFDRMRWFPLPHEISAYLRHCNRSPSPNESTEKGTKLNV